MSVCSNSLSRYLGEKETWYCKYLESEKKAQSLQSISCLRAEAELDDYSAPSSDLYGSGTSVSGANILLNIISVTPFCDPRALVEKRDIAIIILAQPPIIVTSKELNQS